MRAVPAAAAASSGDDDDDDDADGDKKGVSLKPTAKKPRSALQGMLDRERSAAGVGADEDDAEIEYLKEKLGISSTDAFAEGSGLIDELRQDGMDEFFDILLPVAAKTVAQKGAKSLARYDESKSTARKFELLMQKAAEKAAAKAAAKADKASAKGAAAKGAAPGKRSAPVAESSSEDEEEEEDEDEDEDGIDDAGFDSDGGEGDDEGDFEGDEGDMPSLTEEEYAKLMAGLSSGGLNLGGLEQALGLGEGDFEGDYEGDYEGEEGDVEGDLEGDSEGDLITDEDEDEDEDADETDEEKTAPVAPVAPRKPDIFGRDLPDPPSRRGGATDTLDASSLASGVASAAVRAASGLPVGALAEAYLPAARKSAGTAAGDDASLAAASEAAGAGKYVPPAMRKMLEAQAKAAAAAAPAAGGAKKSVQSAVSAALGGGDPTALLAGATPTAARLRQAITGILNKISPLAVDASYAQVHALIAGASRGDVNEALCFCLHHACLAQVRILPAILTTAAALVAALHRAEGAQVGSLHMERLVHEVRFLSASYTRTSLPASNPRALPSLLTVLAALLLFKVVSAQLVLGALSHVLAAPDAALPWPVKADALTAALGVAGLELRQEDPVALKGLLTAIQAGVKASSGKDVAAAFPLLADALTRVRNNQWASSDEDAHYQQLRKWVSRHTAVRKDSKAKPKKGDKEAKHGNSTAAAQSAGDVQINANWEDVLAIPETGRWWLVGAAFRPQAVGLKSKEQQQQQQKQASAAADSSDDDDDGAGGELDALNKLATQQGMNTNVRRAIFSVVMAATDYIDAFDRLCKLNLGEKQDPQVLRVILHCCAQEGAFNPYYAGLLCHICSTDRRWGFTLRVVLWSIIKEWRAAAVEGTAGPAQARAVANVAAAAAYLTEQHHLQLSFLREFDTDALESVDVLFLYRYFSTLFARVQQKEELSALSACLTTKAAAAPGLRAGVEYYLVRYFVPLAKKKGDEAVAKAARTLIKTME
jgi:nucleolar MIF4G domain-containing protein 1